MPTFFFKNPFNKMTCKLENFIGIVKLFTKMTNSAKIHDIDAIHAEMKILLEQCNKLNLTNIFEKYESLKSNFPQANRICHLTETALVITASHERFLGIKTWKLSTKFFYKVLFLDFKTNFTGFTEILLINVWISNVDEMSQEHEK